MNLFEWLSKWYSSMCVDEWEHFYGIKIETLDNPGWIVTINLLETCYQDKEFISFDNDYSDDDWIKCYIKENQFIGVGDPTKLEKIILIFKTWIESQ